MSNLVEEITKFLNEKENERMQIQKRLDEISNEINAAEIFRKSIGKKEETQIEPKFPENQELIDTLKKKRKQNITIAEAIIVVANKIMDNKRRFKVTEVKNIMVSAGYFSKNPKIAYTNLSTPLRRSDKFKYIGPGVYELVEKENNNLFESS